MVSVYRTLLEQCIGGTDLLSDLSDVIDKEGRLAVRKAGREEGARRSMQVLLRLIDASQHRNKWVIFYRALQNNDFVHVITALQNQDELPPTVQNVYSELLLQPENVRQLVSLLNADTQQELVDRNVLNDEDVKDISSERETTGSDTAAMMVLLDRLWRRNQKWVDEVSSLLKLSGNDDLSEKLFLFFRDEEETEEKEVSDACTAEQDKNVKIAKTKEDHTTREDKSVAEKEGTLKVLDTDRDHEQKVKADYQEETEPKILLQNDYNVSVSEAEHGIAAKTEKSPPTPHGDVCTSEWTTLPSEVGFSLTTESSQNLSTEVSDLPSKVGSSMSSGSTSFTDSSLSTLPNQSDSLSLPLEVGLRLSSPSGDGSQGLVSTDTKTNESGAQVLYVRDAIVEESGELTTGMIERIGDDLDASVERSLHRNDSDLYRDDDSVVSEKDDGPKTEKETKEATEKETFPTLALRKYQLELAEIALNGQNTIICAETGTGKTYVALHITQEHLASRNDACVVFLARTNALVEQQFEKFSKYLYKYKVYHLKTDKTAAMGRKLAIAKADHQVFFMTPQILLNNINSKQISLQEVTLLILDECHHTRKREPYNNVMKQYLHLKRDDQKTSLPQVLGLTATIGVGKTSTLEGAVSHILSVCASLDVLDISMVKREKEELETHVAIPKRETKKLMEKEKDEPKHIIWEKMELIENYVGKTEVVNQPKLKKQWDKKPKKRDGKQYQKWTIHLRNRVICKLKSEPKLLKELHVALTHLSTYNEALAVNYLMNSGHVASFLQQKFADDKKQYQLMLREKQFLVDAEDNLLRHLEEVCQELEAMSNVTNDHLKTLRNILVDLQSDLGDKVKGMVFVETRATAFALAQYITQELEMMGYTAAPFTGSKSSESSEGMLEEEKVETLKRYKKGEINLLVATSVGSEGIDVPDCNFIITYNYTGNEADIMQMSGRARRHGSTVTHISDQTIQRREETSLQRALLMARAFDRLSDMKDEDRHRKIREQQETIKGAEVGAFFLESSVVKSYASFAIICWKCQAFAVRSDDVRIYTGQHRIVLDPEFLKRCVLEDVEETSRFKKRIIRCNGCKTKWGTTFGVDEFEVPVLKVKAFLFVPGYTGGDLGAWKERKRFKTWGRVEYAITNIDKTKLMEHLNNSKNDVITA